MGNAAPSAEDDDEFAEFDGIETLGYRVLGVQPNSPASKAGLVSFFDFILGANEEMLLGSGEHLQEGEEYDDVDFPALLHEHKGKPVELLVWNIKAQEKRLVELIPNDDWGGAGLLGVTIKMDDYGGADERLIRVLEVQDGSPAALAGLLPHQDYLLGTTTVNFGTASILAAALEHHIDELVEIYVYNCDSDMVRVVALMPTYSWGGRGLLGAEVGTGYLHGLPKSCRSTIGQSVERKVRWTKKSSESESNEESNGEAEEGTFEMEPHLEMEVETEDEPSLPKTPERATKQPHELGTEVDTQTTTSAQEPLPPPPAGVEPSVETNPEPLPPPPVRTEPLETPTKSTTEKDASEPVPPAASDNAKPSYALPTPPKMTY